MNCYWIQDALMSFIIFVLRWILINAYLSAVVCVYFKFCIPCCTFHFANLKLKGLYYKESILKNHSKTSTFLLVVYVYLIFRLAVFVIDRRVSHFARTIGNIHCVQYAQSKSSVTSEECAPLCTASIISESLVSFWTLLSCSKTLWSMKGRTFCERCSLAFYINRRLVAAIRSRSAWHGECQRQEKLLWQSMVNL